MHGKRVKIQIRMQTKASPNNTACDDSSENVVATDPSSTTRHVATTSHTETTSSQDNAATNIINHLPVTSSK